MLNPFIKQQLPAKPKIKKPKIWLYPRNAERIYEKELHIESIIKEIANQINQ